MVLNSMVVLALLVFNLGFTIHPFLYLELEVMVSILKLVAGSFVVDFDQDLIFTDYRSSIMADLSAADALVKLGIVLLFIQFRKAIEVSGTSVTFKLLY